MIISALVPILENLPVINEDHSAALAIRFLEIHGQLKESSPALVCSIKTHSIAPTPDLINCDHIPVQFQKYRTVFLANKPRNGYPAPTLEPSSTSAFPSPATPNLDTLKGN
jgi:hypothetical protein